MDENKGAKRSVTVHGPDAVWEFEDFISHFHDHNQMIPLFDDDGDGERLIAYVLTTKDDFSAYRFLFKRRKLGRQPGIKPPGGEKMSIRTAMPGLIQLQEAFERGEFRQADNYAPNPWGDKPIPYRTAYGWLRDNKEDIEEARRQAREIPWLRQFLKK